MCGVESEGFLVATVDVYFPVKWVDAIVVVAAAAVVPAAVDVDVDADVDGCNFIVTP